jgi:hypothetical protein
LYFFMAESSWFRLRIRVTVQAKIRETSAAAEAATV